MLRKRWLAVAQGGLAGLVLTLTCFVPRSAGADTGYVVIVNSANKVTSLSKNEVSAMFLLETTKWPDGTKVEPVDQTVQSEVRVAFSKSIHGRSAGSIASYWRQEIFTGRRTPPSQRQGDPAVVDFVRNSRGAIGYVWRNASLDGVRPISVTGVLRDWQRK